MRGVEVSLATGSHLFAGYVPQRKTPAFGIRDGATLTVLGYFIGDAEMRVFADRMHEAFGEGRLVIAAGTEPSHSLPGGEPA